MECKRLPLFENFKAYFITLRKRHSTDSGHSEIEDKYFELSSSMALIGEGNCGKVIANEINLDLLSRKWFKLKNLGTGRMAWV